MRENYLYVSLTVALLRLCREVLVFFGVVKDDDVDKSLDKDHAHVCLEHYQNN